MNETVAPERPRSSTRRTIVKGVAWTAPVMAVSAPAAHAGISKCQVEGSIQLGPNEYVGIRAVCLSQSQLANPPSIVTNYGRGFLPTYLEICNCTNTNLFYRWRETDSLSEFQIEVDGVHNDQDGPGQGFRPVFQLPRYGDEGGCKRFALTYRTAANRPYSANQNSVPSNAATVNINFILQSGPSASGPWTQIASFSYTGGRVWRTRGTEPNFNSCAVQAAAARTAAPEGGSTESAAPSSGSED